ncbi:ParB/RepB/Spo0J family partition protein (plasmid) [Ralstonia pseudosolanacearum]
MTAIATTKKPGQKPTLNLGKLSAVAQIAVQKPTQAPDAEIELSKLYSVKQVRKKFRNLEELAESFKLNGIIEPLVVHEEANGRYRVIVGERRYRAAPLAGLTKVPVIIKKGLTELQIRRLQVTENNDRDDLTSYEEAMGVIEDVDQYGTKEAMAIWNRAESWVSKRMAVKRYADPVRDLLEKELCGDFEVLHCLNQIYDIEESHAEFQRVLHRLNEGLALSRDEARNTLSRLKAWAKQQGEFEQRRKEAEAASKGAAKTPNAAHASGQAMHGADDDDQEYDDAPPAAGAGKKSESTDRRQQSLPSMEPTPEQKAAAERQRAANGLESLRNEVFEWGEANQAQFNSMRTHMTTLGYDLRATEWVLWQGFLSMALPMLEGIGPERAVTYLKKLQGELKGKTPLQLWEELHPDVDGAGRNGTPDMPDAWRF